MLRNLTDRLLIGEEVQHGDGLAPRILAPGERTGTYRTGGDVLLVADDGTSAICGAAVASALVDELDVPAHRRRRFTVAA